MGGPSPRSTGLFLLGFDGPSHPRNPERRRAATPNPQRTALRLRPRSCRCTARGLLMRLPPAAPRGTGPDSPPAPCFRLLQVRLSLIPPPQARVRCPARWLRTLSGDLRDSLPRPTKGLWSKNSPSKGFPHRRTSSWRILQWF